MIGRRAFLRRLAAVLAPSALPGCAVPRGCEATPIALADTGALFVIARAWHTEICLSAVSLPAPLARLRAAFPQARFLSFGWGERAYYMSREASSGAMLRALFPSPSVVLVTPLDRPPRQAFPQADIVSEPISPAGRQRLADALWATFRKGFDGQPEPLGPGPTEGSVFFAATPAYDALHTCNTWTAELLRTAGLPVSPSGVVFRGQVMDQLRQAACLRAAGGWNTAAARDMIAAAMEDAR